MIDAEFRSEERFSRLALAYETEKEKQQINGCINTIIAKHAIKPEIHMTKVSNGKEVLVIEYHDDTSREAGAIFEEMMHALNIRVCN